MLQKKNQTDKAEVAAAYAVRTTVERATAVLEQEGCQARAIP